MQRIPAVFLFFFLAYRVMLVELLFLFVFTSLSCRCCHICFLYICSPLFFISLFVSLVLVPLCVVLRVPTLRYCISRNSLL